jgi:hypothetical protein
MGKRKVLAGTRGKRRVRGWLREEKGRCAAEGRGESGWFWQAREEDRSGGGLLVLARRGRPMVRLRGK